jgi:prolyl-tRNA editing enzyme YbaK/EbsC (Cys-tRNA(Pro) deacylase)
MDKGGTAIEKRVLEVLGDWGVEHENLPCDPDYADTAAFCERYGVALQDSANTILVAGKGEPRRFVACVVLATTRLDVNGVVRHRLGVRKASFASADDTVERTGMMIGGVTVLALPNEVPVWIDALVMERRSVVVGGGSRSMKVRLAPAALLRIAGAEVVEGLAR